MEDYLKDIVKELDKEKEVKIDDIGREYIHSTDLEKIVTQSPYIFKVKIEGIFLEGTSTVDTYRCKILTCLKGTPSYYQEKEDIILITFFKDTVESGKVYYVLLDAEENSPLYALSSKNSVHMEGTEEAEYIKKQEVERKCRNYFSLKHKLKERRFRGAETGIFRDNKEHPAADDAGADYCAVLS